MLMNTRLLNQNGKETITQHHYAGFEQYSLGKHDIRPLVVCF